MEDIRIVKRFAILIGAIVLCAPIFVSAYEPHTTHKGLTRDIVRFFEYAYPDKQLTDEEQSWVEMGAVDEDANIRAVFHFYDPVHNRGLKGNLSSKKWAQNTLAQARLSSSYLATIGSLALSYFRSDSDFSWDRAVFEYVHGDKKRALQSLGHVLHLLEDATVPDHTRNDAHPPFFDSLFQQASPYEHWTSENFNAENISVAADLISHKKYPVPKTSLDLYFDALADYSNKNFFSKSTIESPDYRYPQIGKAKNATETLSDGKLYEFSYYSTDEGDIFRLLLVGLRKFGQTQKVSTIEDPDDLILSDYWNLLSRQAVMHGAGVVKLFFDAVEEERRTLVLLEKNKSTFARAYDNTKNAIFTFAKNLYGSSVTTSDLDELLAEQGAAVVLSGAKKEAEIPVVTEIQMTEEPRKDEVLPPRVLGVSTEEEVPTGLQPRQDVATTTKQTEPAQTTTPNLGNLFPVPIGAGGGGGVAALADTTPPNAPTIIMPADFSRTFTSTSITFSGTAEAASAIATDFGNATTTADASGNWTLAFSGFSQGTTTINFYATDSAGNISAPRSAAFFIDSIGPDIALSVSECANSLSPDGCLIATTTLSVSWNSAASDLAYFTLNQNGAIATTTATSTTILAPNNAAYTFSISARDTAGNNSATSTKTIAVATMPVVINEVAWAGTAASSADEWIELYNNTALPIDLSSWRLYAGDGSPNLTLSGTIPARGYYLIERKNTGETNEATESPVKNITADIWESFGDGLNNSGERLTLARLIGGATTTMDEISPCNNWCGVGAVSGYLSMERFSATEPGTDWNNWGSNIQIIKNGKDTNNAALNGTPKARNSFSYLLNKNNDIAASMTLTKESSPYVVNDSTLRVMAGKTLTLMPGVTVKFFNRAGIIADGALVAAGTAIDPIVFTSFYDDAYGGDLDGAATTTNLFPGDWYSVEITQASIGSIFDRAVFRYGGGGGAPNNRRALLYVEKSSPSVSNSTFEHSRRHGVYLVNATSTIANNIFRDNNHDTEARGIYGGGGAPTIEGNQFERNTSGVHFSGSGAIIKNNIFTAHTGTAIIYNDALRGEISGNSGSGNGRNAISLYNPLARDGNTATLAKNALPYLIADGYATVLASSTLAIDPGVTVKFKNQRIVIYGSGGRLTVNGEAGNPVLFTSAYDDTDGTDATGDGAFVCTLACVEGTQGTYLSGDTTSDIRFAEFRYMNKALSYTNPSPISLRNVTFTNNTLGISASSLETIIAAENIIFSGNTATSTILLP